jgi:ubiquitin-protein ligase
MAAAASTAAPDRVVKVLTAQYNKFVKSDDNPHLLCTIDERDIRVWYFLVGGLDKPYLGGEYIFRLTAPDTFPQRPPSFDFCTVNGVFMPGGPICISIGEYHADEAPGKDGGGGWRASLGMQGFATQVVNGLICHQALGSGIRIENTSDLEKAAAAAGSRAYNRSKYPELYGVFESIIESTPDSAVSQAIRKARAQLEAPPHPPRADTGRADTGRANTGRADTGRAAAAPAARHTAAIEAATRHAATTAATAAAAIRGATAAAAAAVAAKVSAVTTAATTAAAIRDAAAAMASAEAANVSAGTALASAQAAAEAPDNNMADHEALISAAATAAASAERAATAAVAKAAAAKAAVEVSAVTAAAAATAVDAMGADLATADTAIAAAAEAASITELLRELGLVE